MPTYIYIYYTYCYIIIHHLLFTYIQIVAMERDRPWTKRLSCFVILPYPVSTWAYCLGHHMNTPAMWGNWFHLSWDDTYKLVGNGFGCLKVNMRTIAKIFFLQQHLYSCQQHVCWSGRCLLQRANSSNSLQFKFYSLAFPNNTPEDWLLRVCPVFPPQVYWRLEGIVLCHGFLECASFHESDVLLDLCRTWGRLVVCRGKWKGHSAKASQRKSDDPVHRIQFVIYF